MVSVNNLLIFVPIISSMLLTIQTVTHHADTGTSLNHPLTNMKCFDNKLYVGGKDELYILDKNLSIRRRTSTCRNQTACNNNNMVLERLEENFLITCGTGNGGLCDLRNLETLQVASDGQAVLKVSSNMKRPAQVVVSDDRSFMIAVTYGDGLTRRLLGYSATYNYALSSWKYENGKFELEKENEEEPSNSKKVNILIKESMSLNQYVIYYKDSFQHNWNSYFVTNQKNLVGDAKYVSKLVRLCQNDTGLFSYTDILIECKDGDGNIYNLIQDVIEVADPTNSEKKILIGIFTKGNDPEKNSGDSVICSVMLDLLDKLIMQEKEKFATNCTENDKRYLPDIRNKDHCLKEADFNPNDFKCKLQFDYYRYTIGEAVGNFKQVYKLKAGDGILTSLHSDVLNGNKTVIIAGTTTGKILMMNLHFENTQLTLYDSTVVDSRTDISGICSLHDDNLYVMTERKIFKLDSSNCSEFTTCEATMKGKNPSCGWCVFENRATRKNSCPDDHIDNYWLSSFRECIQLELDPKGTPAEDHSTGEIPIKIQTKNIPGNIGRRFNCVFKNGLERIDQTTAVRSNLGSDFTCNAPQVRHHTNAVLELVVELPTGNVILAKANFLFYDCQTFMKCGECVKTTGAECRWSVEEQGCGNSTSAGIDTNEDCPKLEDNAGMNYIPRDTSASVKLLGSNLPNSSSADLNFWCNVKGVEEEYFKANILNNEISCDIKIASNKDAKKDVRVRVKYGTSLADSKELDDLYMNYVTVYDCEKLAGDCSHCKGLNKTRYTCYWCNSNSKCLSQTCSNETCPGPNITRILPSDGPIQGNTKVTIDGKELGIEVSDIRSVMIGTTVCNLSEVETDFKISLGQDFDVAVPNCIVCTTKGVPKEQSGQVQVTVNDLISSGNVNFTYKVVEVTRIDPPHGPKSGGTILTIHGKNLGVGNRDWTVLLESTYCLNPSVIPNTSLDVDYRGNFTIECETGNYSEARNLTKMTLSMDGEITFNKVWDNLYQLLPDPNISDIIGSRSGFLSGGTILTVIGNGMTNANKATVKYSYKEEDIEEACLIESPEKTTCKVPKAPKSLSEDLMRMVNASKGNRKKRDTCDGCIDVTIYVKLDGKMQNFVLRYFRDPSIYKFGSDGDVLLYGSDERQLVLKGESLDLVATKNDFNVTIGIGNCTVFELTKDTLTCTPPNNQPSPAKAQNKFPEVNVNVGNIHVPVGYLQYEEKLELIAIIAGAACGGLVFIVVIVFVIGCMKYRKVGKKAKAYEKSLSDMEMEIKTVARQEFLDMHTTMSTVNKNLVEQGFPYHSYQQFACNVMFSVDYLWTEPVVSNGKMTDDERLKANKGMETLESLISNKFFLVSVITTMENEKRFFIREKSNLAGNLCAVLMGRMDYLNEILKLLMTNLVQESSAKKHKTLFRRCESITEKLLSNWLSLCLYPHVKSHSGSPLYLLYMATQKTMESGPIDAVTCDAKYTLSEEKLLKKWSSSVEEDGDHDLKFEAKTLTLNVVVDNGDEIFKCKALDCDTISQVKTKCLNQIYVNYPASQLPVGGDELALEWHEGFGGALKLRDEDNTSKHDGHWVRLNTLAHYNVKDESNMALIDPHSAENNMEDYVNLANINMDGVCDGSIDSSQPLTPHDEENPHDLDYWHLVKKEEESSKQGKSAIAELYLNRLFTTKQSLMEYMRPLFDLILDHDRCPPPTKFLYDFLDELGEKNRVETDTVHAWKSHSYAIRVWASLMKMPNTLFDVKIPPYMDENLSIISQVFIESFSLASQKFTKDSPSQKLIFHHEMNHYRERVKEFYKNVKVDSQNSDEYRQYLAEVNRLQQQTNFNKISALYRFYKQLKPYFEDILENLAKSKEASTLHLDRKLEQVIAIMEEED